MHLSIALRTRHRILFVTAVVFVVAGFVVGVAVIAVVTLVVVVFIAAVAVVTTARQLVKNNISLC